MIKLQPQGSFMQVSTVYISYKTIFSELDVGQ